MARGIKNGKIVICAVCSVEKYRPAAKMGRPTCGIKCAGIFRRRPFGVRKPEGFINGDGYRQVRRGPKDYPPEHRLVMSIHVGRDLKKNEVVHHWDENRVNNKLENLAVMTNAAHKRLHLFADRHGIKIELLKFSQPWLAAA